MVEQLVPESFQAPVEVQIGEYTVRKFRPEDAETDYDALMRSKEIIWKTRGRSPRFPNWPTDAFTLEENIKDVMWLSEEFDRRTSFNYLIEDKNGNYRGCIYIYPMQYDYPELQDQYDADFSMWVTPEIYDAGLYPELYQQIIEWVKTTWPFQRIYDRNALNMRDS